MKNGRFVYKNAEAMQKMHDFYDRTMDSLGIPYREEYIDTSYGRTHIVFAGDESKPPVLTLHGGNGITPLNLAIFKPLLKTHRLIAPDVIGMPGKSEPHRNLNTYKDDFGCWLCEVLDSLGIDKIPFAASSYSSAMTLSLAKVAPERIEKAVLLVPSGISHGALMPITKAMTLPMLRYYRSPSESSLTAILDQMSSRGGAEWTEFFDLMMSSYKMEMRPPKEYTARELQNFRAPVLILASDEDIFFPASRVFPRAIKIFPERPTLCRISGKHLPSEKTMERVCRRAARFLAESK